MNRIVCATAVIVLTALLSVPSTADDAKLRKALTANYAAISSAFKKADVKAMGDYLADGFSAVRPGGQSLNKEQILAEFDHQTKATKDRNWVRKIDAASQEGEEAIVTVQGKMTGTITDQQGKSHKMEFDAKAKDTWAKTGKGWKLKKTELLEGKMLMDGKEMPQR